MATINPLYDAEAHENRMDYLEQEREHKASVLMQDEEFIDRVFAEGFPVDTMARIVQHIQTAKTEELCDGPYRAIGRLICDHIAERAWKEARKK